jgi:hypothetical protein
MVTNAISEAFAVRIRVIQQTTATAGVLPNPAFQHHPGTTKVRPRTTLIPADVPDSSGHPRGLGIRLGVFDPADFSIRSGGVVRLNSRAARHVAELAVTLLRILIL